LLPFLRSSFFRLFTVEVPVDVDGFVIG